MASARVSGAVVGVDLGGTKVAAELVAADGQTVRSVQRRHTVDGATDAIRAVQDVVAEAAGGAPVAAVGIAVAGWLSADREFVRIAANLGMQNVALPSLLATTLGVDVRMYNDGDATAFAEYGVAAHPRHSLLALTLGTGLGAGLVINGMVITGGTGLAGELGHQQTRTEQRPCVCGGSGCAELYASGGGIAAIAGEQLNRDLTADEVLQLARSGDPVAVRLLEDAGQTLGQLIATAVPLVDPDVVVIGGGFGAAAGDLMRPALQAEVDRRQSMTGVAIAPRVITSELGGRAAAIGAAALLRRARSTA